MLENQRASTAALTKVLKKRVKESYSSGESDSDGDEAGGSLFKKFGQPRRLKKRLSERPELILNNFEAFVKGELGWSKGMVFNFKMFSTHLQKTFGIHTILWRIHRLVCDCLDCGLMEKKPVEAFARMVQLSKALHQAGLENGRWAGAQRYVALPDPLARPLFAGDSEEAQEIASYSTAIDKLAKITGTAPPKGPPPRNPGGNQDQDQKDQDGTDGGTGGGKNKKKGGKG